MSLNNESTEKTEVKQKSMSVLKWMKILDSSGSEPTPRHGHRAVVMNDLIIILSGESCGIVDELNVYDTTINQWFTPNTSGDKPPGRALYGLVIDNTRLLTFGGMLDYGKYSNDLYELQTLQWHWSKLKPRSPLYHSSPCPRMGHSFTLIDNMVYLFGGLTNNSDDAQNNILCHLNDLYTLNISSPDTLAWNVPQISGVYPPPRESHSAVAYTDPRGRRKLIIYGGMNGYRLEDIWTLDICTMSWNRPIVFDPSPLPRSLHTAMIVQNCMFIFGGWVPFLDTEGNLPLIQNQWECSNWFGCLNLETMTWKELNADTIEYNVPGARAGHCAVLIETKIYVWSGGSGYKTLSNNQICYEDFWFIEVGKPQKCDKPNSISEFENELEIKFNSVPTADAYILQIQKCDFSSKMIDYSSLPLLTPEVAKEYTDSEDGESVSINTNSAVILANPNEKLEISSQDSIVNTLHLMKDQQIIPVTAPQEIRNKKIKTVQSANVMPLLAQNFKGLKAFMQIRKRRKCIKSPSTVTRSIKSSGIKPGNHVMRSRVTAVSTTLNNTLNDKARVILSSNRKILPKPDFKKIYNMSNKDINPLDITVPLHQNVITIKPVLPTPVFKTVLKTATNDIGNQTDFQNFSGPQSNVIQYLKTNQSNQKGNQNIQNEKMTGTYISNEPLILNCINPMANQQCNQMIINPLMKTVPLNTVNVRLPVVVNSSPFVTKKSDTNILVSSQIMIVTNGSNLGGTQTLSASQAHITNSTSVSNSPIKMVMTSSGTLTNSVTITTAKVSYCNTVISDESSLITTGGKTVALDEVSGQNNMAFPTSNSGGNVHMKNMCIVSTQDIPGSQIDSEVPSSVEVSTNLPTRNRPILNNLLIELGIIDSNNTPIYDVEESTDNQDFTMEELENHVPKENDNMAVATRTESALTRLEVETSMANLTNTSSNNMEESTSNTTEESENN